MAELGILGISSYTGERVLAELEDFSVYYGHDMSPFPADVTLYNDLQDYSSSKVHEGVSIVLDTPTNLLSLPNVQLLDYSVSSSMGLVPKPIDKTMLVSAVHHASTLSTALPSKPVDFYTSLITKVTETTLLDKYNRLYYKLDTTKLKVTLKQAILKRLFEESVPTVAIQAALEGVLPDDDDTLACMDNLLDFLDSNAGHALENATREALRQHKANGLVDYDSILLDTTVDSFELHYLVQLYLKSTSN